MIRPAMLALVSSIVGCAGMAACNPATALAGRGNCELTVATAEAMHTALDCAKPGAVIRLLEGHYGTVMVRDPKSAGVVVRSADLARPARFSGMTVIGAQGLTLADLRFDGPITGQRYALFVRDSRNVAIEGVRFSGHEDQARGAIVAAVMLRQSSDLVVSGSHFEKFQHGLAMLDVERVRIHDNRFERLRTDGVRGGGVSDLVVEENVFTGFVPQPGDHPDGIQLWSTRQDTPGRNVVIRHNLVYRGAGAPTQGIFVRDTFGKLPFENVSITGNMVVGGLYNGISLSGAVGGEIADNEVLPAPDRDSRVRIENARGVSVRNNRAGRYIVKNAILGDTNRIAAPTANPRPDIARWAVLRGVVP